MGLDFSSKDSLAGVQFALILLQRFSCAWISQSGIRVRLDFCSRDSEVLEIIWQGFGCAWIYISRKKESVMFGFLYQEFGCAWICLAEIRLSFDFSSIERG